MNDVLTAPPAVLKLAGHPIRWNVLTRLARSDYRVQELVGFLQLPQNLVSYHLRQLRDARLVTERKSSADERSIYYSLDLDDSARSICKLASSFIQRWQRRPLAQVMKHNRMQRHTRRCASCFSAPITVPGPANGRRAASVAEQGKHRGLLRREPSRRTDSSAGSARHEGKRHRHEPGAPKTLRRVS